MQATATEPIKILLVEDHAGDAELVQELLSEAGVSWFYLTHVGAMQTAIHKVKQDTYDVVLLDLSLPDSTGLETVTSFMEAAPGMPVVVLSGTERDEMALDAVKHGAQDYLIKGQVDGRALARTMLFAIERKRMVDAGHSIPSPESKQNGNGQPKVPETVPQETAGNVPAAGNAANRTLVGRSPSICEIYRVIQKAGAADATVLITGETGTGKELVAQALHEAGPRQKHPLVAVNCGSIPETLLESVLFGHAKGAFTGADREKRGLFEVAKEGTLFLDEIGELPISLQPKILRALERREVLPVGSTTPVQFAARVVAATNRDLPSMIQKNLFRSDLYYRLNVIEIRIPPLRERPEDVPMIAEYLLRKLCARMKRRAPQMEPEVLRSFEEYPWPGNVREMSNILERLLILNEDDCIREKDLANVRIATQTNSTDDLKEARSAFEREHIQRVLEKCGGNKERAARAMGIDLSSLYRKLST